jgi:hypothetical protein
MRGPHSGLQAAETLSATLTHHKLFLLLLAVFAVIGIALFLFAET